MKPRGPKLTTGRFETRQELIECINFMYWDGDRSVAACARNTHISETTAAKLVMSKSKWELRNKEQYATV